MKASKMKSATDFTVVLPLNNFSAVDVSDASALMASATAASGVSEPSLTFLAIFASVASCDRLISGPLIKASVPSRRLNTPSIRWASLPQFMQGSTLPDSVKPVIDDSPKS